MRREDRVRVQHMFDACQEALSFAAGRNRSDLENDRLLLYGLVRCIEIVGEAASRVSEETRASAPEIPWRSIVAMRNRLIHGYFDINPDLVWKTVTVELPRLIPLLKTLIQQ